MPTATNFTAFGKGNGFPFCVPKVDVTDQPSGSTAGTGDWVTLGGYGKGDTGSVTQAQINLSLSRAMKIYWNLNGLTCDFDLSGSTATLTIDISQGFNQTNSFFYYVDDDGDFQSETNEVQPIDRVCFGVISSGYSWEAENDNGSSTFGTSAFGHIYRMYEGSTSDESNFIGYGATVCEADDSVALGCNIQSVVFDYSSTNKKNARCTFMSDATGDFPFVFNVRTLSAYDIDDVTISGTTAELDDAVTSTTSEISFSSPTFYTYS